MLKTGLTIAALSASLFATDLDRAFSVDMSAGSGGSVGASIAYAQKVNIKDTSILGRVSFMRYDENKFLAKGYGMMGYTHDDITFGAGTGLIVINQKQSDGSYNDKILATANASAYKEILGYGITFDGYLNSADNIGISAYANIFNYNDINLNIYAEVNRINKFNNQNYGVNIAYIF